MRMKIFLAVAFMTMVLVGCGQANSNDEAAIKDENVRELVSDYSLGNIESESASITSHQLIVSKSDGEELVYDLSEEDFFVSIAPYVKQTHP